MRKSIAEAEDREAGDEEEGEEGILFDEQLEFLGDVSDSDTPPHLRDLATAAERGNVEDLRLDLG